MHTAFSMLLDEIKTIFEILVIILGGIFFLWKLFTGWLIINLKVSIDVDRQKNNQLENMDLITFKIVLSKGSIDTLWLDDVSVRITPFGMKPIHPPIEFDEIYKFTANKERKISWENEKLLKLTLAPEESLHFGRSVSVPSGKECLVELAVLGERSFWRNFQWRSSISSPPLN